MKLFLPSHQPTHKDARPHRLCPKAKHWETVLIPRTKLKALPRDSPRSLLPPGVSSKEELDTGREGEGTIEHGSPSRLLLYPPMLTDIHKGSGSQFPFQYPAGFDELGAVMRLCLLYQGVSPSHNVIFPTSNGILPTANGIVHSPNRILPNPNDPAGRRLLQRPLPLLPYHGQLLVEPHLGGRKGMARR